MNSAEIRKGDRVRVQWTAPQAQMCPVYAMEYIAVNDGSGMKKRLSKWHAENATYTLLERKSMSEIGRYEYKYDSPANDVRTIVVDQIGAGRYILTSTNGSMFGPFTVLPRDPAELHALTEAIHGRKIAAIVYEDDLPEVTETDQGMEVDGLNFGDFDPEWRSGRVGEALREYWVQLALARHVEARDAAAKDAERAAEDQVVVLAEGLEDMLGVADDEEPENASSRRYIREWIRQHGFHVLADAAHGAE